MPMTTTGASMALDDDTNREMQGLKVVLTIPGVGPEDALAITSSVLGHRVTTQAEEVVAGFLPEKQG